MSCFSVEILDSNIKTLEIETCVGDQASNLEIINYDNTNLIIESCPVILPSEYTSILSSGILSDIYSGSGINIQTVNSGIIISVSGLTSSLISDFSEAVDDRVGSGLFSAGSGISIVYNDGLNSLIISATGLQPSGNYTLVGHTHYSSDIIDLSGSVLSFLPSTIVYTTGNQLINGLKTFNSTNIFNNGLGSYGSITIAPSSLGIAFNIIDASGTAISVSQGENTKLVIRNDGYFGIGNNVIDVENTNFSIDNSGNINNGKWNATTIPVNKGGTGRTSYANGQLLIGSGTSLVANTLSSGSGILISNGSGSITISADTSIVSISGHSHIASDITNFNNAVNNLLPVKEILAGNYIVVSSSSGNYTISASGLQPSGNYVTTSGNQTISGIKTFLNNVIISGDISAPTGIFNDITVNDNFELNGQMNILAAASILASGPLTFEVNKYIVNGSGIFTSGLFVGPTGNPVAVALSGHHHPYTEIDHFCSGVAECVNTPILAGSGIELSYIEQSGLYINSLSLVRNIIGSGYINISAVSGLYTVVATGLQPSGNYSIIGHNHISSDITDFNNSVSGLLPIVTLSGVSGISINNNGPNYTISLNDPTIQLSDITDLASNARTFLLNASSNNLQNLMSDETGSGSLVFNTSPSFSGTPTVPTANSGTNTQQIASTAFVRTEISNLVNSAPTTLDTLNELAAALGNDANFSTTVTNSLASKANLSGATFTGLVSGPSGDFVSLKINGTNVSPVGHTHVVNDITDFNTGVSGLLPVKNITAGNYISVSPLNGNYTISTTGLQPSGNYSVIGHTHTSSDITNFNTAVSGLLPVKNIIGGSGIQVGSVSGDYTITAFGVAASSASSIIVTCHNLTGSLIPKMSVVYINGGHGNEPTINLAIANGEATSSKTFGITLENISDNQSGDVVVIGSLIDINTNQFGAVEGTTLYLSPTVSGGITTTKPTAPYHMVGVGKIVRNHNNQGIIQVNIQNGFELGELHNVAINGTSNGQFLQYNSGSGLWVPSSSGNFSSLSVNNTGVVVSVGGSNGYLSRFTSSNAIDNSSIYQEFSNKIRIGTSGIGYVVISDDSYGGELGILTELDEVIAIKYQDGSFRYGGGGIGLENIVVASGGNVGIGTDTPTEKLTVNGNGNFNGNVFVGSISGSDPLTISTPTASMIINDYTIFLQSDAKAQGDFYLEGPSISQDALLVTDSNRIAVSLTSPSLTEIGYVSGVTSNIQTQLDNKQNTLTNPVTGTGVANHIPYWSSTSGLLADSGQLYWDDTNNRLGIGTISPSSKLDVTGDVNIDGNLTFDSYTESVVSNGNSGTSKTLDLTTGTVHTCTLTGNCTFTMPTATAGKSFTMFLNTGSGNYTASFSGVRWADSAMPTATILANKVDIYSFISDGSYWYGSFSQNYG